LPPSTRTKPAFRAATVRNILDFPKKFDPPAAVPQRFYTHHQARAGDRHVPAALAHHFNRTNWPVGAEKKAAAPIAQAPIDIRERMRGKWSKTG
jgi:hypothetical protein